MTKADELRAKQERLRAAAQQAGADRTAGVPPAAQPTAPKTLPAVATRPLVKDVRLTVDLAPARYRDLQGWLNDAAVQLGRSRVTKQDALDALVALLLRDDVVARRVLAEIRDSQ